MVTRWWMAVEPAWRLEQLRAKTHDYWHEQYPRSNADEGSRIRWYIENLLPQELHHATQYHALRTDLRCDVLTLVVGYSIEPLLLALSVYEPAQVILLLHQAYGTETGKQRGQRLQTWIETFLTPRLSCEPIIQPEIIARDKSLADKPETVFRALCDHVLPHQRAGKRVVVDITGGKKSMDAGAFLFAAYAHIPVSYVDFDEYDPQARRPYGFSCRIDELENPYAAFGLRDWERVRQLYAAYHFHAAAETLAGIIAVMQAPAFAASHRVAAEKLLQSIRFYAAWDDGDYQTAFTQLAALRSWASQFIAPTAVTELGPGWADLSTANHAREAFERLITIDPTGRYTTPKTPARATFFESNVQLITYAYDELAKIERLKNRNEDARSALLRAAGLDELLLKARWVRLFTAQLLHEGHAQGPRITAPDVYEALLGHDNVKYMRQNLRAGGLDVIAGNRRVRAYPDATTPNLDYERGLALSGDEIVLLRNQTIHQYIPIPPPIAEAAYQLVAANLADFIARWACLNSEPLPPTPDTNSMAWDVLCQLCAVDFLPLL